MEAPPKETKLRIASFAVHATRGLVRDQSTRRTVMCVLLAIAAVMVVVGSTILRELLEPREHVLRFLFFWLACAWFTVTALLLALLDLLLVRAQARAARRAIAEEFRVPSSGDPNRTTPDSQTERPGE